jgi:iron complex outermembrane receptor protein
MSIRHTVLAALRSAAALSFALAGLAGAQQGSITGRVTDEASGQPLSDVRVQVSGTSLSTLSNQTGAYTVRLSAGTYQLRAVRVGYSSVAQNVTVRAGETITQNFALRTVPISLEEVVVTATGEWGTTSAGSTGPMSPRRRPSATSARC